MKSDAVFNYQTEPVAFRAQTNKDVSQKLGTTFDRKYSVPLTQREILQDFRTHTQPSRNAHRGLSNSVVRSQREKEYFSSAVY